MKFSLVQSELYRSLQLAAGVVPTKSTAQHLTSVRLEATPDGRLCFTGTDLDTFLVTNLHATVDEPGISATNGTGRRPSSITRGGSRPSSIT